jgi:hypothetical protein
MNTNTLLTEAKRLAAEYPTFLYRNDAACSYSLGGDHRYFNKGCILGQAIKRAYPEYPVEKLPSLSIDCLAGRLGLVGRVDILTSVQRQQDEGTPWGEIEWVS